MEYLELAAKALGDIYIYVYGMWTVRTFVGGKIVESGWLPIVSPLASSAHLLLSGRVFISFFLGGGGMHLLPQPLLSFKRLKCAEDLYLYI